MKEDLFESSRCISSFCPASQNKLIPILFQDKVSLLSFEAGIGTQHSQHDRIFFEMVERFISLPFPVAPRKSI